MSTLTQWFASYLQQWFDAFRARNGLSGSARPMPEFSGRRLLHVGCGPADISSIPLPGFHTQSWQEIRLDINEAVHPDIIATMTEMYAVPDGHVDAIYSSHNIEHLFPHEVSIALREFHRVLNDDGFVVLTCPDLQSVCSLVAQGKLLEPAYHSPVGPIAPLDILYGHREALRAGNHFMAHRSGFTLDTLVAQFQEAGFPSVLGHQRASALDLWMLASKRQRTEHDLRQLAADYLSFGDTPATQ